MARSQSTRPSRSGPYFWISALLMVLGVSQLSNCTAIQRSDLKPAAPMQEPAPKALEEPVAQLASRARVVLDQRCVGCHGCYDAPCQLKLTNLEGIARGGTKLLVYDGARTRALPPTRLGIDAHGVDAWRAMGFHSVLGRPNEHPDALPILTRMLDLKQKYPLAPRRGHGPRRVGA